MDIGREDGGLFLIVVAEAAPVSKTEANLVSPGLSKGLTMH